jgi:hypothetical protein
MIEDLSLIIVAYSRLIQTKKVEKLQSDDNYAQPRGMHSELILLAKRAIRDGPVNFSLTSTLPLIPTHGSPS